MAPAAAPLDMTKGPEGPSIICTEPPPYAVAATGIVAAATA